MVGTKEAALHVDDLGICLTLLDILPLAPAFPRTAPSRMLLTVQSLGSFLTASTTEESPRVSTACTIILIETIVQSSKKLSFANKVSNEAIAFQPWARPVDRRRGPTDYSSA